MPGTTTHIARQANVTHGRRKAVEKLPVQRLVLQLIGDASDVFVGYPIIAGLRIHGR